MLTILGVVAGVLIVIILVTLAIRVHAKRRPLHGNRRSSGDTSGGGNKVVVTTIGKKRTSGSKTRGPCQLPFYPCRGARPRSQLFHGLADGDGRQRERSFRSKAASRLGFGLDRPDCGCGRQTGGQQSRPRAILANFRLVKQRPRSLDNDQPRLPNDLSLTP